MPTQETQSEAARSELARVLASPGFTRNERLSRFLRFVVERRLEGRDGAIKESLLAIVVFGRPPDYDPKQDPIVRTEASRLRARLSEYYLGDGKDDPLVIELPKGGYVPAFRPPSAGAWSCAARTPLAAKTALGRGCDRLRRSPPGGVVAALASPRADSDSGSTSD